MKFSVVGADKESGDDIDVVVVASDLAEAEAEACKRGVLVTAIRPVVEGDTVTLVDEPVVAPAGPGASVGGAAKGGSVAGKTSHGSITVNASSPNGSARTGDGTSAIHVDDTGDTKMEYHIVMNQALYLLETAINKYLREGWEPQGGLTVGISNNAMQYFQALIRRKP